MIALPEQKLDALLARHALVESELASNLTPDVYVKLSREFAELEPVIVAIKAYRAIAGENLSIWTNRAQRTMRGYYRVEGAQVYPGDAVTLNLDSRAHLTVARFVGAKEAPLLEALKAS